MLTLYTTPTCSFCKIVKSSFAEMNVQYEEKNAQNPKYLEELLAKGGKRQVPLLVDEENNVILYESADIIEYGTKKYGENSTNHKPRVPNIGGVCQIDDTKCN